MDEQEQKQLRKAIERDAREALETTMGGCNVETEYNEYEYSWRDGKAIVRTESDLGPAVEYVFQLRVEMVAIRVEN
jgi:hypothetical protein